MLGSSLCNYDGACILAKGAVAARNTAADREAANNTNKKGNIWKSIS